MINTETICFIAMLNELAEKTKHGYIAFKDIEEISHHSHKQYKSYEAIIYDETNNKVILNACLLGHHDIISYYDSHCNCDYSVTVNLTKHTPCIDVIINHDNMHIIVEAGHWYIA